MIITIANLNTVARPKYDDTHIYIGRSRSPLNFGNRWTHIEHGTLAKFNVPNRDDAIERYRLWLEGVRDKDVDQPCRQWILGQVKGIAARDLDVTLYCFCVPNDPCHGEVLKSMILELLVDNASTVVI